MISVRVHVSAERRNATEAELNDAAGFEPKREDDGTLVYKFHSREFGSMFLISARNTAGVTKVMEA